MIRHAVASLRWRDLLFAGLRTLSDWLFGKRLAGVCAFRSALAQALGRPPEAIWLTGAGRCALYALVASTRVASQDEALVPGYTCVVVPNVFLHLGVPVRYVDIAPGQVNPTLSAWLQAIGPNTRWVVIPHNYGITSEVVTELRQRFPSVLVVEDVAHALGAQMASRSAVGVEGHAAFFSFEYAKCLTTGLGGALLVNDPNLRSSVSRALANQHASTLVSQFKVLLTLIYHLIQATWPSCLADLLTRMARAPSRSLGLVAGTSVSELSGETPPDYLQALPDFQARIGLAQCRRLAKVCELRREQARRYSEAFAGSTWLRTLVPVRDDEGNSPTLLRYPVEVHDPEMRDVLRVGLRTLGIEPGEWFDDVVHPSGSRRHGYCAGDCPNGESLARRSVNLPLGLHAELTHAQWVGLRTLAQARPASGQLLTRCAPP